MTGQVEVDGSQILFPDTWEGTVDVLFDGHRVWSFAPGRQRRSGDGLRRAVWPRALQPYLRGESELTLRDHVSSTDHAVVTVRFDDADSRVTFEDSSGYPLALDKWDNLVRTFSHKEESYGSDLLADLDDLFRVMHEDIGVPAFIAYGSLLGAVRTGSFIAHDTDADISYVSRHETPAEIVMESFRIEHELRRRGWGTHRNTAGFMQVWRPGRTIASHIDIFTGYFAGGHFAIDRWVRGPAEKSDLLPLGEVTLEGHTYPAPAKPEKVLELTYGPSWRVPDPAFKFTHPRQTIDRARGWLGYHRWIHGGRPTPGESAVGPTVEAEPSAFARWTAAQLGGEDAVLELGCRSGVDGVFLAETAADVRGVDHMEDEVRNAARRAQAAGSGARFERASFYDLRGLVSLGAEHARHARSGRGRVVASRSVVEHLRHEGRAAVWLAVRTALGGGGRLFLEIGDAAQVEPLLAEATARGGRVERRQAAEGDATGTWCVLSW